MQGAAAQLAELIVGDKILMVNSRSVVGLTLEDTMKVLLDCKDTTTVYLCGNLFPFFFLLLYMQPYQSHSLVTDGDVV